MIQLTGAGLLVSVAILTVMITPIMTALIIDALGSVPRAWHEGAIALGLHPLRATITVSLRAVRPAIIAATALATARAIGEAIVIDMVSGGNAFTPKPQDGLIFFFEPLRTLASEIIGQSDNVSVPAVRSSIYAIALLLMFSAFALSITSRSCAGRCAVRAGPLMASVEPLSQPALASLPGGGASARRCEAGACATG